MVEVVGAKYVEGKSKTSGKDYKAYIVHYVEDGAPQGFNGCITGDAFIAKELLNGRVPVPGDKMVLSYNKNGFLTVVAFA